MKAYLGRCDLDEAAPRTWPSTLPSPAAQQMNGALLSDLESHKGARFVHRKECRDDETSPSALAIRRIDAWRREEEERNEMEIGTTTSRREEELQKAGSALQKASLTPDRNRSDGTDRLYQPSHHTETETFHLSKLAGPEGRAMGPLY